MGCGCSKKKKVQSQAKPTKATNVKTTKKKG